MKITYDREADVGIEVLNASSVFDHSRAPSVELEYLASRATRP